MNRFFTLLFAASCLTAVGQVTYPYNPDGNADSLIGVSDIQDLLSGYGLPFSPSEILVDGQSLTVVLTQLQNSMDSLSGLGGSGGSVLDMPLGTVLPTATESVPEGWMLCDGREISIQEYQGLYDLIGTTYGAGDSAFWAQVFYPATTFNIPDLRGRTIIGANDMGGEQSDVLTIHQASAGQVGGEELHQLSEDEMPSHGHGLSGNGIALTTTSYWSTFHSVVTSGSGVTEVAGGDQPHNNMQPYMALNYMIKVQVSENIIAELEHRITEIEESIGGEDTLVVDISNSCVSCCNSVLINVDSPIIKFIGDSNMNGPCYYQFSPPSGDITEILVLNASEKTITGIVGNSNLSNYHWVTLKGVEGQWFLPWDRE